MPRDATTASEPTGHFVAVWRPWGAETAAAPLRTTIRADLLDDLRDPSDPGVVVLPGFVRYRVGRPHPLHRSHVYLHRLDPDMTP